MSASQVTDKSAGLFNRNIVTFYGFADSEGNRRTGQIVSAPAYMLLRVPESKVKIGDFPMGVVPLEQSKFKFHIPKTTIGATYQQFAVTLAYAIHHVQPQLR
jgi:hypothetical protein